MSPSDKSTTERIILDPEVFCSCSFPSMGVPATADKHPLEFIFNCDFKKRHRVYNPKKSKSGSRNRMYAQKNFTVNMTCASQSVDSCPLRSGKVDYNDRTRLDLAPRQTRNS
jgi:hypothetical protein